MYKIYIDWDWSAQARSDWRRQPSRRTGGHEGGRRAIIAAPHSTLNSSPGPDPRHVSGSVVALIKTRSRYVTSRSVCA